MSNIVRLRGMTKHLDCVEQFDLLTQQGDKTITESWLPVVNSTLKTANFVCRDDFLGKIRHLKSPNSHSKHIPTSSGGSCGSGRINRSPSKARVAQSGLPQSTSCGFDFEHRHLKPDLANWGFFVGHFRCYWFMDLDLQVDLHVWWLQPWDYDDFAVAVAAGFALFILFAATLWLRPLLPSDDGNS